MNEKAFYDISKIDSKNKLFNFIIGARSCGKTFACKKRMISEFLEHGHRFVYVRRRPTEIIKNTMKTFFSKLQIENYYTEHIFTYEDNSFYIDGELMGYVVPLSTSINVRSIDYLGVTDIYYEEFCLLEDDRHKYLKDEVFTFLELYSTIARFSDVRVWFIGNKIREFNPYYLYFDIKPPESGIKVWKDFAIENIKSNVFVENMKKTRFGNLISGTSYSNYNIENQSFKNNDDFILSPPKRSTPVFNIYDNGTYYTMYHSKDGRYFLKQEFVKTDIILTSRENLNPDRILPKQFKEQPEGKYYIKALKQNKVFYNDSKCEEILLKYNKQIYF